MKEYTGWLFDLYSNPRHSITVWLLSEDGISHSFEQEFNITFYMGGPFHRLRQLWKHLQEKQVILSRTERDDLYSGKKNVLKVEVPSFSAFEELFKEMQPRFPDLSYYDVDIPLILRYAAAFNVFPLAYCKVEVEQGWNISKLPHWTRLGNSIPNCRTYASCTCGQTSILLMLNLNIYQLNSNSSSIVYPSRIRTRFWVC